MSDLDNEIREVLGVDPEPTSLADASLHELVATTFRGRMRWWSVFVWIDALVFTAIGGWAVYRFFQAETVKWMIFWAGLFGLSILTVAMLKIFYWALMNRNAVIREVKRLELRVHSLSEEVRRLRDAE